MTSLFREHPQARRVDGEGKGFQMWQNGEREGRCYGLNVCVAPNSYIEVLTLNVMVFGNRAFGR